MYLYSTNTYTNTISNTSIVNIIYFSSNCMKNYGSNEPIGARETRGLKQHCCTEERVRCTNILYMIMHAQVLPLYEYNTAGNPKIYSNYYNFLILLKKR